MTKFLCKAATASSTDLTSFALRIDMPRGSGLSNNTQVHHMRYPKSWTQPPSHVAFPRRSPCISPDLLVKCFFLSWYTKCCYSMLKKRARSGLTFVRHRGNLEGPRRAQLRLEKYIHWSLGLGFHFKRYLTPASASASSTSELVRKKRECTTL